MDLACLARLQAHRFQAQVAGGRPASGGDQHLVHVQRAVIVQRDADGTIRLPIQTLERGVHPHVDALVTVGLDNEVRHLHVKAAQHPRATMDLRDLRTQTMEDAGKFHPDVAAAHHRDPLREHGQVKDLVGADGQLHAGQVLGHHRFATGSNEHLLGRHFLATLRRVDGQPVGAQEAGVAGKALHAGLVQVGGIGAFQPRDLGILGRHQLFPVEGGRGHVPAEAPAFLEALREARSVYQQLLGHAAADDAGAAVAEALGNAHTRAVLGRDAGRAHAARAATDDEKIEVERGLGHGMENDRKEGPDGAIRPVGGKVTSCRRSGRRRHPDPAGCSRGRSGSGRWRP